MDSHLRALAGRQADVVATWQLLRAGWTEDKVCHNVSRGGWRQLDTGVYLLTSSAATRRQRWFAAVLTAPGTVLSHGSGGACYGFYRFERGYEVVTRPGQGGRRHPGGWLTFLS